MTHRLALAAAMALALVTGPAVAQTYTINGLPVDARTHAFMADAGLPSGAYWLVPSGNWGAVGDPTPWGNIYAAMQGQSTGSGTYTGQGVMGGTGSWSNDGSWSYHSNHAGGSVGQDGSGCTYAFGWSNC